MLHFVLPVIFWLFVLVSQCVSVQISCAGDIRKDWYIVTFLPNTTTEELTDTIYRTTGTQVVQTYTSVNAVLVRIKEDEKINDLMEESVVISIECDSKVSGDGKIGRWGLDRIISNRYLPNDGVDSLLYPSGWGVHVFVIDSGINTNHQEFNDYKGESRIQDKYSTTFVGQSWEDENGHGTHVAGIVAGRQYGVAKNALIHAVRVLDDQGAGLLSNVITAIDYVVGLKKENQDWDIVVLLALGGEKSYCENEAIKKAVKSSIHFAVSAGNDGTQISCNKSPSSLGGPNGPVLTAIAYTQKDTRHSFSNWGNCTDIAAPGDSIYSAFINSNQDVALSSGTSVAAAYVAGVMSLFLERNPGISPSNLKLKLLKMATPLNPLSSEGPHALLYADFQINACSASSSCCNVPIWAPDGQTCGLSGSSSTCLNGICVAQPDTPTACTDSNNECCVDGVVAAKFTKCGRDGHCCGEDCCLAGYTCDFRNHKCVAIISSIVEGDSSFSKNENPPSPHTLFMSNSHLLSHVLIVVGALIVLLLLLSFALFLHRKCSRENKDTTESHYFPSMESERTKTTEGEGSIAKSRAHDMRGVTLSETSMITPENFGTKSFQGKTHSTGKKQLLELINSDIEVQGEPPLSDVSREAGGEEQPSETEDDVAYDPSPSAPRLGIKVVHPSKTPRTSKIPQTFMSMLSSLAGGEEGPRSLTKKRSGNREVYSSLRTEEKQDIIEMANMDLGVAGIPMEDELVVMQSDVVDDGGVQKGDVGIQSKATVVSLEEDVK